MGSVNARTGVHDQPIAITRRSWTHLVSIFAACPGGEREGSSSAGHGVSWGSAKDDHTPRSKDGKGIQSANPALADFACGETTEEKYSLRAVRGIRNHSSA